MTTHYIKECHHCGIHYSWQGSGQWVGDGDPKLNNDRYCPDCMKVIREALTTIPKRVEHRFVHTDDYTVKDMIKLALDTDIERLKLYNGEVPKVFPEIVKTGSFNIYRTEEVKTIRGKYRVSYWTEEEMKSHPNCVKKEVLWDLINNCEYKEKMQGSFFY